jgi:beta-lactam-binding protein with PASTA domain
MSPTLSKILQIAKRALLVLAGLAVLFFLVDDLLMPRYVQQGKTTKVPNVLGLSTEEAMKILSDSGLVGKKAEERQDKQYPIGTVAMQNPLPGSEVKYSRGVYLTISGGEPQAMVPKLRGRSVRDATFALERVGLILGSIRYEVSAESPANTIIEQTIPESTNVVSGSSVSVVVSQGPSKDQVPVPDAVRKMLGDGEKLILQAGLKIGNIVFEENPDLLSNTIIEQMPRAGEMVPGGQAVDLVVTRKSKKK